MAVLVCWGVRAQSGSENVLKEYDLKIRRQSTALDSIRAELERGRERVEELRGKEGSYLEQLTVLEKTMETARTYLSELDGRIDTVTEHVALLKDSLAEANDALALRQKKLRKRLRIMYKTGRLDLVQIMLSSASFTDMLYRMRYFQELENYDEQLLRSIDSTRAVIATQTATMETQREQLVALRAVKEAEQSSLAQEQKKRSEMLKQVQGERSAYEQMVAELERAQKELTALLASLQKRRTKAKQDFERGLTIAFGKRKGKLPWPLHGAVVRGFGKIVHPTYQTVTMSPGIDIAASAGARVMCVAPGRVDYVGWMRGYGKFVIVNHGGSYVTIYAHLGDILVQADQEVEYGTVIGVVGDTGSLTGTKLHFQIRKDTQPLDPREWLEDEEA